MCYSCKIKYSLMLNMAYGGPLGEVRQEFLHVFKTLFDLVCAQCAKLVCVFSTICVTMVAGLGLIDQLKLFILLL